MLFQDFLSLSWRDHENDAVKVAARFSEGLKLISNDSEVPLIANLIVHVLGQHLNKWDEVMAMLNTLLSNPLLNIDGKSFQSILRWKSSIDLAIKEFDLKDFDQLETNDRILVLAQSVSILISIPIKNNSKMMAIFDEMINLIRSYKCEQRSDPVYRLLAQVSNNLACYFEEIEILSKVESKCMVLAAKVAREYWELVGGWLEIERAEYRLGKTYLKLGEYRQALDHANLCLEICQKNDLPPIEHFFGYEALALIFKFSGDQASMENALDCAKNAFNELSTEEKVWCELVLCRLEYS